MTRTRRIPALLLALSSVAALLPSGAGAESSGVALEIDLGPRRIEVGDRFQAVLRLSVPQGLAIGPPLFPDWEESWGEAEILDVAPGERTAGPGGQEIFRQTLTLTTFTTGELTLPAVTVELPAAEEILRIESRDPIVLQVDSVLPEGEEMPAPKPPAAPRALAFGETFWWTAGAAAALCLFAAALALRRRSRAAARGAEERVDPRTAFARALARLEGETDLQALIVGLSLELRRYVGRSFGFPAAESTTTEIRRRLHERPLPASLVQRIDGLLRRCDEIKFARGSVERATCSASLAEAAALADAIESNLTPPGEEPPVGRRAA